LFEDALLFSFGVGQVRRAGRSCFAFAFWFYLHVFNSGFQLRDSTFLAHDCNTLGTLRARRDLPACAAIIVWTKKPVGLVELARWRTAADAI
jgi:hypothetical protein